MHAPNKPRVRQIVRAGGWFICCGRGVTRTGNSVEQAYSRWKFEVELISLYAGR